LLLDDLAEVALEVLVVLAVPRGARDLDDVHRVDHRARRASLREREAHRAELLHARSRAAELLRHRGRHELRLLHRVDRLLREAGLHVDVGRVLRGDFVRDRMSLGDELARLVRGRVHAQRLQYLTRGPSFAASKPLFTSMKTPPSRMKLTSFSAPISR